MTKKLYLRAILLAALILLTTALSAVAEVGYVDSNVDYSSLEYYIKNYEVELVANPDRSYDVREKIDVYFNVESRGIFRTIPASSSAETYDIKNVNVPGDEYTYDGYGYIRIGNPDIYITGDKSYVIEYTLAHYADYEDDYDYLYTDLLGNEWDTYIQNFSATVRLPDGATLVDYNVTSGGYGSTGNEFATSTSRNDVIFVNSTGPVPPYNSITLNARLNEGDFYAAEKWVPALLINNMDATVDINEYGEVSVVEKYDVTLGNENVAFSRHLDRNFYGNPAGRKIKKLSLITADGEKYEFDRRIDISFKGQKGERTSFAVSYDIDHDLRENQNSARFNFIMIDGATECLYENVRITVNSPFNLSSVGFGSQYGAKLGTVATNVDVSGSTAVVTAKDVALGDEFDLSLFIDEAKFLRRFRPSDIIVPGVFAPVFALCFLLFLTKKERPLTVPIEFYPPFNLNPAEMGYIIDSSVSGRDVTSLIYYWASKGYLKIEMRGKSKFTLHKLGELGDGHREYEKTMYRALWSRGFDNKVTSGQLEQTFYATINDTVRKISASYMGKGKLHSSALAILMSMVVPVVFFLTSLFNASRGYGIGAEFFAAALGVVCLVLIGVVMWSVNMNKYKKEKHLSRIFLIVIAAVVAFIGMLAFTASFGGRALSYMSAILSAVLIFPAAFFAPMLRRRTDYGTELIERAVGFRQFLLSAEKDRLEMLLSENPDYYYDILPYAQVLGVSGIWEKKFDGLLTAPPDWYYGSGVDRSNPSFGMFMAMNALSRSMTSVPPPQNTGGGGGFGGGGFGGGGFGGGGFSGGGSGGGGGGRW